MKNIVKSIIETAQECKNGGEYDTAFSLADIAKNLLKKNGKHYKSARNYPRNTRVMTV